jgi:ribonuclease HII
VSLQIGCDEVGLGSLAGPLVVAAVVLPADLVIKGVRDSKKIPPHRRLNLVHDIAREATYWVIVRSDADAVDRFGVKSCLQECMKTCVVSCLEHFPEAEVVVDGVNPVQGVPASIQRAIVRADDKFQTVGAASIIAKVYRDRMMIKLADQYPLYNFSKHKGYPTRDHLTQLRKWGPCPEHRRSYAPVRRVMQKMGLSLGR